MATNGESGVNGEVQIRVADLEEKERREILLRFYELRRKLCPLYKPLRKTPSSDLEILLFKETIEDAEVSEAAVDECGKLFEKMNQEMQLQHEQNGTLIRNIKIKLDELVANENRDIEYTVADGDCAQMLKALEAQLDSMSIGKTPAAWRNIQQIRTELRQIWKTYKVPEDEALFPEFAMNEATEEIYQIHVEHLKKWKEYQRKNQALFSEIKQRYELKEKLQHLQVQNKSKDRFKNRGGLMLKLQSELQSANRDLPKCEAKLLRLAQEFERDNGKKLVVDGEEIVPLLLVNANKTPNLTHRSSLRNIHRTTPLMSYASARNLASSKRRSTSDPDLGAKRQRHSCRSKEN